MPSASTPSYAVQSLPTGLARMLVETALSLVTTVCGLKKVFHRTCAHFETRLAYVAAMFNTLLGLNRTLQPEADPQDRLYHLAQYAL